MWIVIAQFICLSVAIVLVVINFDLDHKTPGIVRYSMVILAVLFFGAFLASFRNRDMYEHAAAIAFTGVGVLILAVVAYLIFHKQVQMTALRISLGAVAVSVLLWAVGSCSDIKRQEIQIQDANAPVSTTVTTGDTTTAAIGEFFRNVTP